MVRVQISRAGFYGLLLSLTGSHCDRRKGIEARRRFVEPVGAWFSQIGRLHEVYHLWQYPCVLVFSQLFFLVFCCSVWAWVRVRFELTRDRYLLGI